MRTSTRRSDTVSLRWLQREPPVGPALRDGGRHFPSVASAVGLLITVTLVACALTAPMLAPYDAVRQNIGNALARPSWQHWLGTDELGRDLFSRILFGIRLTLIMSVTSVALALTLGASLGLALGYRGSWLDLVFMRVMDMLMAFPGVLLAIVVIAILGIGLGSVVIAVAVSAIPEFALLARGSVLVVKVQDYVVAARALGADTGRILWRHLLPNVVAPLTVQTTLRMSTVILVISGLGFLGLGAQPPTPELGTMLSTGRSYLTFAPHVAVFPGLAIMLMAFGLNMVGDGLRDLLDPRTRA